MNNVIKQLKRLSASELEVVGKAVKNRWNRLNDIECAKRMKELNVGDEVQFTGRHGERIVGSIISLGQKNAIVTTKSGQCRVHVNLLFYHSPRLEKVGV